MIAGTATPPKKNGRTIRLFLVDGTAGGLTKAEIMNWSGKVLLGPRTELGDLLAQPETQRTGVYFLVGPEPTDPLRDRVYIGESDDVSKRLAGHHKDATLDFFTRATVVVSADANVTKAHARYLESRLIELAKANGRAVLHNGNQGSPVSLPESDRADMEAFLDQIQLILPVLGLGFTQPKVVVSRSPGPATDPTLAFSAAGAAGRAREVGEAFVLLRGATCRKQGVPSWTSFKALRDRLVAEGRLVPHPTDPANFETVEDIPFQSPSAAASVIAGRNTNGREAWRVEGTGESYQEWTESRVAADAAASVGQE